MNHLEYFRTYEVDDEKPIKCEDCGDACDGNISNECGYICQSCWDEIPSSTDQWLQSLDQWKIKITDLGSEDPEGESYTISRLDQARDQVDRSAAQSLLFINDLGVGKCLSMGKIIAELLELKYWENVTQRRYI